MDFSREISSMPTLLLLRFSSEFSTPYSSPLRAASSLSLFSHSSLLGSVLHGGIISAVDARFRLLFASMHFFGVTAITVCIDFLSPLCAALTGDGDAPLPVVDATGILVDLVGTTVQLAILNLGWFRTVSLILVGDFIQSNALLHQQHSMSNLSNPLCDPRKTLFDTISYQPT